MKTTTESPAATPRFAGLVVVSVLGQGTAGDVFRVRDTATGAYFVVKRLKPGAERNTDLARFTREADLMRRLNHPSLMPVLRVDATAKPPYYVMPCREGLMLTERVKQGSLAVSCAMRIARDASCGLAEAHRIGIVHRDVKPANIFLELPGRAVVLDFGLAKDLQVHEALTAVGALIGTPSYMAPEQCRGEPVDAKADVYSLGVTLIELLLGKNPFASPDIVETLRRHLTLKPRRLDALLPGRVSPEQGELVHRMIEKDPAHRPHMKTCFDTFADFSRRFDGAARAPTLQVTRPALSAVCPSASSRASTPSRASASSSPCRT